MNFNYSSNSFPHSDVSEASLAARRSYPDASRHTMIAQIVLIAVAVVGALFFARIAHGSATLTLDFGTSQRTFRGEVTSDMTVLDALDASVVSGGIPLQFSRDGQDRTVITRLDGRVGPLGDRDIALYLNDHPIDYAAIHKIPVRRNDRILVRLLAR